MKQKANLLKGILSYSISTWVNFILGIVSVALTTRLLKPDVYGLIAIFFSFSSVLMYVLTLGLDGAYIRFYNEPPGNDSKNQLLYKNIVYSTFFCVLVGSFGTLLGGTYISYSVFGIGSRTLAGLVFLYTFCNIILRYLNISFRMSFKVTQYNFQNILINCLSKILVILAAFFTDGFLWIAIILTTGLFSVLIVYFITQRKEYIPYDNDGNINASLTCLKYDEYFKFALFSAPTYIVVYLNTYLNQQIVRSMLSSYALGVFSSTVMFGSILSAVKGGFSTFWSAYVYQNYNNDSERIGQMHNFVLLFTVILSSLLVCTRDIIYLFIGQEYHSSKVFFSLLLILPVLTFLMETTDKGIALSKKNHISLINHSVSVVTNILLCLILIPKLELMGASIANACSAVVLYCLNTFYGQKYYKTINSFRKSLIGTFLILSILIIPTMIYNIWQIIITVLFINFMAIFVFKTECVQLIMRIKSVRLKKK